MLLYFLGESVLTDMDTFQHYLLSSTTLGPCSVALGFMLIGTRHWKAIDENMSVLG